jgi:GT2 family glycosyltransferase
MILSAGSANVLPPSSLIICSRGRPTLLRETIESILEGDDVPSEMVIVDQSTAPDERLRSWQAGRGCEICYIWSTSTGLCRARNMGLNVAKHDLVAFTDDDMWVARDWYGKLIRALVGAGPRAVVTGRVLPGVGGKRGSFVPATVLGEQPKVYEGRIGTDVLAAGHMAMYCSALREIGAFDERLGAGARFQSADDNDYGFRLLEAGYKIVYVPEAVIYHRAWRTRRDYFPLRWSYGRGKGGFYAKYLSLRDPYMLKRAVGDLALNAVRFPWRFLHRPQLAVGDLVYAVGVMSGMAEWLLVQPRDRSFRNH